MLNLIHTKNKIRKNGDKDTKAKKEKTMTYFWKNQICMKSKEKI